MLAQKHKPCKYCGSEYHQSFACMQRPRKPLKSHPGIKQRRPMNKVGPVTKQWMITRTKWLEQNKAPYYFCHYCGIEITRSEMTLDHKEPRSLAPELRYDFGNLVPSCWNCNMKKASTPHDKYAHICH